MDKKHSVLKYVFTVAAALTLVAAAKAAAPNHDPSVEILVPGSVMQAVEGIDIGPDGMIYGTSIHARRVYRIDPASGLVTVAVESPYGESDDVAVGPKGSPAEGVLAWTAQHTGEIRIQRPGGMPIVLMPDVPQVNPIAFSPDGRLFTAQSGFTGASGHENELWELDVIGNKPPRLVAKNKGRLNGFGFGPDGRLYAPHFGTNELFAIDVTDGTFTVIAEGVGTTAAVKPDTDGNVWNVDYITGDLWFTDIETGKSRIFANFPPPLDNLAVATDGTIYLASLADSAILGFNPKTGERWDVTVGSFTVPLGLSMTTLNGQESILAADPFGYRFIDPDSGAITRQPEMWSLGGSSSAVANDDIIVTTYSNYGRIRTINRKTNEVIADSTAVATPRGVALTSTGEAIVADADGNRLVRVLGEEVVEVAAGLKEPVALLLENDTSALVTEVASGTISRVDLRSGRRTEVVSGLHDPRGIARLPDGRVAIVEPGGGRVVAIDLATGVRTELAHGLPLSIERQELPENTPLGIAVDAEGTIYVSCGGDNSIVKIRLGSR
jgi:sugar lactone lactonase YvrE